MEAVAYELGSSFMRSHVFFRGLFQGSEKTSIFAADVWVTWYKPQRSILNR